MMLTFEHHDQIMICSDLKPGTWYSLQLTAHNGAGSRVVTTQFATLSLTGDFDYGDDVVIIIMIMMIIIMIMMKSDDSQDKPYCRALVAPLALDLTRSLIIIILSSVYIIIIVIIIVIIIIIVISSSWCNQVDGSIALPIISAIIVTSTLLLVGVYVFRKRRWSQIAKNPWS